MESRKTKETKINSISESDIELLTTIVDRLSDLKSNEPPVITEDSVRVLEYTVMDILNLYSKHQKLLTRWLKQGYLLD
tara:strand:- start:151 stop:384 length:234 start_codon:yes stop_codon:yes gene_type:complete